jgi:hypothetical protein
LNILVHVAIHKGVRLGAEESCFCHPLFIVIGHRRWITVPARSKVRTVFASSNTGIVGSNPTRGMDDCVRIFCVCVILCVGSCLATG